MGWLAPNLFLVSVIGSRNSIGISLLLLFSVSFVYFLWGIVKFLSIDAGDKGNSRGEARNAILWGVIGMVIMFSVYGIIRFLLSSFGIPNPPYIQGNL